MRRQFEGDDPRRTNVEEQDASKTYGRACAAPEFSGNGVILTGLPGAGVAELGRRVAERLGCAFAELGADADSDAVRGALRGGATVLTIDGRALRDAGVRENLRGLGKVFYLSGDVTTIIRRASCDSDVDREEVSRLFGELEPLFFGTLHFIVSLDQEPEEMLDDVLEKLRY